MSTFNPVVRTTGRGMSTREVQKHRVQVYTYCDDPPVFRIIGPRKRVEIPVDDRFLEDLKVMIQQYLDGEW